jgi:hypothetical protein
MKNIKDIDKDIKTLSNAIGDAKSKAAQREIKQKIKTLNQCKLLLQVGTTHKGLTSMLERNCTIVDKNLSRYKSLSTSRFTPSQARKHKLEFLKLEGLDTLLEQIKTLEYLLSDEPLTNPFKQTNP